MEKFYLLGLHLVFSLKKQRELSLTLLKEQEFLALIIINYASYTLLENIKNLGNIGDIR